MDVVSGARGGALPPRLKECGGKARLPISNRQFLGPVIRERCWTVLVLFVLVASLPLGCTPTLGAGRSKTADTLTIGAYSVVREAFHQGILPAFARFWKKKTGRDVRFEESYTASGAQSRAIASGFDADVAVLSLEGDVTRLVKAGLVREGWNQGPSRGMITRSLVVVGVREHMGSPGTELEFAL